MIAIFIGCTGCMHIPGISRSGADSLNVETRISASTKTAVVVPLFGIVSENWAIDVEKALQNPRYNLVVLWIESPGGGVTETKILTHKLKTFQKKYNKPIYVYSERILASGAYWAAAAFEKIIISPAGYAGSIGVYMVRADFTKFYDKLGVKYNYIASDSTKVMGNSATSMEDWEREYWQWSIDVIHITFMNHVWKCRLAQLIAAYEFRNLRDVRTRQDTLSVAQQFKQIANGLLYNAEYSILTGLVDNVMYFDEFVKTLQKDGYIVVTSKGKIITEFYPFSSKENSEKIAKMQQEIWDHLQVKQK